MKKRNFENLMPEHVLNSIPIADAIPSASHIGNNMLGAVFCLGDYTFSRWKFYSNHLSYEDKIRDVVVRKTMIYNPNSKLNEREIYKIVNKLVCPSHIDMELKVHFNYENESFDNIVDLLKFFDFGIDNRVKVKIKNIEKFQDIPKFKCPSCECLFIDEEDFYVKEINKRKNPPEVKCLCGCSFCVTYDIFGSLVGFLK